MVLFLFLYVLNLNNIFNFENISNGTASPLTKDFILNKVSDAEIFYFYHGPYKLGGSYKSLLRNEKNPSVTFFKGKSGKIIYWDYKENKGYDCFDFVKSLFNLNYDKTLQMISFDFGLTDSKNLNVLKKTKEFAKSIENEIQPETLIQFSPSAWDKDNLSFWSLYEITQSELEKNEVFPVKELFINKKQIFGNTQRYAKIEKYLCGNIMKTGVKIYSPHDKISKWINSIPLHVPFGMNQLTYDSDVIVITKSFKDMIVLKKFFKNVIATQNESEGAIPEEIIAKLTHFKKKLIIFDNFSTNNW